MYQLVRSKGIPLPPGVAPPGARREREPLDEKEHRREERRDEKREERLRDDRRGERRDERHDEARKVDKRER